MATTSLAVRRAAAEQRYGPTDSWGGWRTCIVACVGFSVLFVALGLYMHAFAWYAGSIHRARSSRFTGAVC